MSEASFEGLRLRTILRRLGPLATELKSTPMQMPSASAEATKATPRMEPDSMEMLEGRRMVLKEDAMAYSWKAALRTSR